MPGSVWKDTSEIVEQLTAIIELLQTITTQLSELLGDISPRDGVG